MSGPVGGVDAAVADALAYGRSVLVLAGASLAVGVHGDHVLVGPLVPADEEEAEGGGCVACALAWWADVHPRAGGGVGTAGASGAAGGPVDWAPVVCEMVARVLAGPADRWRRAVLALDRSTGSLGTHRFLVHPECPTCAPRWRAPRRLDLAAPQPAAGGPLRTRRLDRVDLRERLVDDRFGPVVRVGADEHDVLARVTAHAVVPGRARREAGVGRDVSVTAGEQSAVLRSLGRALGGFRRPTVPVTVARWCEVADRALDPRTLGTQPSALVGRSPYQPFDPDRSTSWVWGRSTREDRPVLVPEHVAYGHERGIGARFLAPSPTGRAVGGTREEAALHALLQVVEHDALVLAWSARARLVEVRLADGGEPALARDLLAARGLHLRVLDATTDLGVPVALAVVTADDEVVRAGLAPATAVASGVAATPRQAVRLAVTEAAADAVRYPATRHDGSAPSRYRAMLDDHELVRTSDDHAGLHGLLAARALSTSWQRPAGVVTEADLDARAGLPADDVGAALRELLGRVHTAGMDAVVVDQSAPEVVEAVGLHAATVLVPGAVPLVHGHRDRRTGLARLEHGAELLVGALPPADDPSASPAPPAPHPFR